MKTPIIQEEPIRYGLYASAFDRTLEALHNGDMQDPTLVKQLICYGIRFMNSTTEVYPPPDTEAAKEHFAFACQLIDFIGLLTPRDLMQLFPAQKRYDGRRYGVRDYWSTMDVLGEHGLDAPMGEEALPLLLEYMNPDINDFTLGILHVISMLNKARTGKSLLQSFFENVGNDLL